MTYFPSDPTHLQYYTDHNNIRWQYNSDYNYWEKIGHVNDIPKADEKSNGLMPRQLKKVLDMIQESVGGFGIISNTKGVLPNFDKVVTGNIELVSDSLFIKCVDQNQDALNCKPDDLVFCNDSASPGLEFSLTPEFINSIYVYRPGNTGADGREGEVGDPGEHGYGNGPVGDKGIPGLDSTFSCELIGVEYEDVDELSDTAVVDIRIRNDNGCKMDLVEASLDFPNRVTADKLKINNNKRIPYTVTFPTLTSKLSEFQPIYSYQPGTDIPPGSIDNLYLVRLSKYISNNPGVLYNFNSNVSVRDFLKAVAESYDNDLQQLEDEYLLQCKEHIESIDSQARQILANLVDQLVQCEMSIPVFNKSVVFTNCEDLPPPPPPTPPVPPPPPPVPPIPPPPFPPIPPPPFPPIPPPPFPPIPPPPFPPVPPPPTPPIPPPPFPPIPPPPFPPIPPPPFPPIPPPPTPPIPPTPPPPVPPVPPTPPPPVPPTPPTPPPPVPPTPPPPVPPPPVSPPTKLCCPYPAFNGTVVNQTTDVFCSDYTALEPNESCIGTKCTYLWTGSAWVIHPTILSNCIMSISITVPI